MTRIDKSPTLEINLVQELYPYAFMSENFLRQSAPSYGRPWAVREIVQNFLDQGKKGMLDDVDCKIENIKGGRSRVTIEGSWPFEDPTPILALDSQKTLEYAGGNGIGLRQTIMRLCRDMNVPFFRIEGNGWDVEYKFKTARELNEELKSADIAGKVESGWLAPDYAEAESRPQVCRYVFETNDQALLAQVRDFYNIGVGSRNEFLKDPHVSNKHGVIRWEPDMRPGRLFIKGQVNNYASEERANDAWDGPQGVSIAIKRAADYQKSIDRPAIDSYELENLVKEVLEPMSTSALVDLLGEARHFWSNPDIHRGKGYGKKPACLAVIDAIAGILYLRLNDGLAKRRLFSDGKDYFYLKRGDSGRNEKKLIADGAIICPASFWKLGLESVDDQFDGLEEAKKKKASGAHAEMARIAENQGVSVSWENLEALNTSPRKIIEKALGRFIDNIEELSDGNLRIHLKANFAPDLISDHMVDHRSQNADDNLIFSLRSLAGSFLAQSLAERCFIAAGKKGANLNFLNNSVPGRPASLVSRTVSLPKNDKYFMDIDFTVDPNASSERKAKTKPKFNWPLSKRVTIAAGAVAGAVTLTLSGAVNFSMPNQGSLSVSFGGGEKDQGESVYTTLESTNLGYGQSGRKPFGSRGLEHILRGYSEASIDPDSRQNKGFGSPAWELRFGRGLKEGETSHKQEIENFKIIESPTANEIKQLELLREYVLISTGYYVENQLFIYTGNGVQGVNIGGNSIGIHRSLLVVSFFEALGTTLHEISHNVASGHEANFQHMNQAINLAVNESLSEALERSETKQNLTPKQRRLLEIEDEWNALVK